MRSTTLWSKSKSWTKSTPTLLLSLFCAGSVYANTYYVNDGSVAGDVYTSAIGNAANSGSSSSPFLSIQAAIDASSSGDTIYVDAGTYNEGLNVNKSDLKVIGAGMSLTTIDHGSTSYNNAGIYISQNDVEMSGFTLTGNSAVSTPRYGLKVGTNTTTTDNVVLKNVRVENSYRSGFDLARPKNISLIGVEAINNGGAGIFMSNVEGANLQNITTSGNPWTGVSIATRSDWSGDTYGVVFSGTNSFGENGTDNGGVQLESDNTMLVSWSNDIANGADVTIQGGELGYALSGTTTNTFNAITYAPYFRFYQTLAQAQSAAAGSPDHVDAPRYIRDADNSAGEATTNFYVYDNGNMTIKAALDHSIDGNTVNVGDGTYTGNLQIDKNISLLSINGAGTTILDGDDAGSGLGTLYLTSGRNGVTIGSMGHGFTVKGIDGPAGIEKAAIYMKGAQSNITIVDNIIESRGDAGLMGEYNAANNNVTIDHNHFTGKTFNGANPAGSGSGAQFTLLNVPRQAVVFGGGGGTTNTMNFTFTNNVISTITGGQSITDNSGNPVAAHDQGNMMVTLDLVGTNLIRGNTFDGTTVSWLAALRTRGTGYTIDSNIFNGNYIVGMATGSNPVNAAYNYWGAASGPQNPTNNPCGTGKYIPDNVSFSPFYVDAAFSATATGGGAVHNLTQNTYSCTIQDGVDNANAGDVLEVAAGTYTEQVDVDKNLTIRGAGVGSTIIEGMANMPLYFTTSANNHPVIYVHNAANVTLKKFTLDGDGQGNSNYRYQGIAYSNAGGLIDSVEVTGIRETPLNGNQHGIGIFADASAGTARSLTVQNSKVIDFQKNAMSFSGVDLTANVYDNEVIGAGPLGTPLPAQNGVQFYGIAGGTIQGNHIEGFEYTPSSYSAAGILCYSNAGTINITGNTLSNNEVHIYNFNGDANVMTNDIQNGDYGVLGYEYGTAVNMLITNNNLAHLQRGISGYSAGAQTVTMLANQNSITDIDSFAVENGGSSVTIDASCNWYGTADSASIDALMYGTVTYSPWLTNGSDNDAAMGFQPVPGSCNGSGASVTPDLYLVSDSSWRKSTVVTTATANTYPWTGVATVPAASTFTLPVTVGQPYPWEHLFTVDSSEVITSLSGVTYYRKKFNLSDNTGLNVRFRMFVDDDMEIFINGQWVALEDGMGPENWRTANHDLLFMDNGTVDNGHNGGDSFDYVTSVSMDNILQTGENDVILAIRNRTSKPDKGGFSFRMDIDKSGAGVIVKSSAATAPGVASNAAGFNMEVYPNPTHGVINLASSNLTAGQSVQVMIFDMNGRMIKSGDYTNGESIAIDLSGFAKGVYSLRVESGNDFVVKRIILD